MKKGISYLSVFILLCFFADSAIKYSIAQQINDQSPYSLSFASIGANLLESRLDCWAKIKTVNNFAEMDQELSSILTFLDLPLEQQKFLHQEQDGKKILRYELLQKSQSYLFTLQTESGNSYFLLSSTTTQNDHKLYDVNRKLKKKLDCTSYFRYQGVIQACPDKEGRKQLTQIICKCLGANIIDQYEEKNVTSLTAYSPELESIADPAQIAGMTYNVQVAICVNQSRKQTYIYMGFPLLLNDY